MSKQTPKKADNKEASYYDLHTGAGEDLVTATKDNTPRYSEAELNKYRSGKTKWKFPQWLKVLLIKVWFYGAVCFFVFWGLGLYLRGLDMYFVAAVVTRRGAAGFFMNLAYGFLLMFLVITAYQMVNTVIFTLYNGSENAPLLNVEPIIFGLTTMGADTLCVTIRNTLRKMVDDARRKV